MALPGILRAAIWCAGTSTSRTPDLPAGRGLAVRQTANAEQGIVSAELARSSENIRGDCATPMKARVRGAPASAVRAIRGAAAPFREGTSRRAKNLRAESSTTGPSAHDRAARGCRRSRTTRPECGCEQRATRFAWPRSFLPAHARPAGDRRVSSAARRRRPVLDAVGFSRPVCEQSQQSGTGPR